MACWWLESSCRTYDPCTNLVIIVLVKERGVWMEVTGEESSLIILIISKAMLGMQVYFLWDTQHKPMGPLTMFWLNFWQGR